jgi:hypothetical protein
MAPSKKRVIFEGKKKCSGLVERQFLESVKEKASPPVSNGSGEVEEREKKTER